MQPASLVSQNSLNKILILDLLAHIRSLGQFLEFRFGEGFAEVCQDWGEEIGVSLEILHRLL